MAKITIAEREIGTGHPCFIVAELSENHHQNYEEAVELIHAAQKAGADAVKLQTYTPDTITIDSDKKWFFLGGKDTIASWKETNLYGLYKTAYTPWEWQPKLKKLADELGIILFSSVFDATSVDFLEEMDVPCYKIASYEVVHLPLIKKVAQTKKPVIMSTGFASLEEIEDAVNVLRENGTTELALLHCVTGYSAMPDPDTMHLATIQDLAKRFNVVTGFSDNNAGIEFPIQAAGMGASIIEKHLILNRMSRGHDARFSIEPDELKQMVDAIQRIERARGSVHYGPASDTEENFKNIRPSIFVVQNIPKGHQFTKENIRVIRPGYGLKPKHLEEILGKNASEDIERGTPLAWDLVS